MQHDVWHVTGIEAGESDISISVAMAVRGDDDTRESVSHTVVLSNDDAVRFMEALSRIKYPDAPIQIPTGWGGSGMPQQSSESETQAATPLKEKQNDEHTA